MNFLLAIAAHALVGAAVGQQYGAPVAGCASAVAAFFATTILWMFFPASEDT